MGCHNTRPWGTPNLCILQAKTTNIGPIECSSIRSSDTFLARLSKSSATEVDQSGRWHREKTPTYVTVESTTSSKQIKRTTGDVIKMGTYDAIINSNNEMTIILSESAKTNGEKDKIAMANNKMSKPKYSICLDGAHRD